MNYENLLIIKKINSFDYYIDKSLEIIHNNNKNLFFYTKNYGNFYGINIRDLDGQFLEKFPILK